MDIRIPAKDIHNLNVEPIQNLIESVLRENKLAAYEQSLQLLIDYPREEGDPRELSEIPEIRLWYVRLDALYPWLPFMLDWKSGDFARYTAMLVPHQFHRTDGIQFNPEALEIFVMGKIFCLCDWLPKHGIQANSRVQAIAQILGYELDDDFLAGLIA